MLIVLWRMWKSGNLSKGGGHVSSRAGITLLIYHPELPLMFRISYLIEELRG